MIKFKYGGPAPLSFREARLAYELTEARRLKTLI